MEDPMVKRAITLGGGGPAAGLHIGVLEALANAGITFDVWALSCIGAWVGIVYNQFDDKVVANKYRAQKTYEFFRDGVFRDDESYKRFPINMVFGADWGNISKAMVDFVTDADTYKHLWDPQAITSAVEETMSLWFPQHSNTSCGGRFTIPDEGDRNRWILNQVLAPNPFVRYVTSMMYLSHVTGLSRINYPDSQFMKSIRFNELSKPEKPFIFHNAWNLDAHKLALFSNRDFAQTQKAKHIEYNVPITASSLCACSALPFVEETVEIDKVTYCEGALIDTVNFESLIQEHHKPGDELDEIWVSRIVDAKQVRKPKNLHDGLANLCQLFAATVGEDDVKLFKYHVRCDAKKDSRWQGTVVEIHVPGHINFKWNHSNLRGGRKLGKAAAEQAIAAYYDHQNRPPHPGPHFINEDPAKEHAQEWREVQGTYQDCRQEFDA
ncbi:patatin-like phospholipase family protein [Bradyrhizobium sp. CCGUVB4N]|uniref:patatin-like phospholipase family protein n=1 Tax=Bradyrhizobium sp. CCGUVB4N TaxID=2949631 RepID=UPI0020B350D2|nr:patatin-like phospholipase family protein [Bradyrhizobium sp. CCGUVB4N]MCP3386471.1 patatin-like phospholipase family protein [Bradyrhizobium sp. CCGUVB4N]